MVIQTANELLTIPRNEIASQRQTELSMMPDGLLRLYPTRRSAISSITWDALARSHCQPRLPPNRFRVAEQRNSAILSAVTMDKDQIAEILIEIGILLI